MKKPWIIGLLLLMSLHLTHAASSASLQRGAKLFMNYCSGCHSLKYIRYNEIGQGIGLVRDNGRTDEGLLAYLLFTQSTPYDAVRVALSESDAKQWFGKIPPDLSLTAQTRGVSWLKDYLHGFYEDTSRPFNSNNRMLQNTAMPNVLAPLQHALEPAEFDESISDLVNFLVYVNDPMESIRYKIGLFVFMFLIVLMVVAHKLQSNYWHSY